MSGALHIVYGTGLVGDGSVHLTVWDEGESNFRSVEMPVSPTFDPSDPVFAERLGYPGYTTRLSHGGNGSYGFVLTHPVPVPEKGLPGSENIMQGSENIMPD